MNIFSVYISEKAKFTKLLIDLILLFVLAPFSTSPLGYFLITAGFLTTNLLVANLLLLPKIYLWLLKGVAATIFALDLVLFKQLPSTNPILTVVTNLCYSGFILLAIIAIGNWIFKQRQADIDIVNGGICIFLLLGLLWFTFYQIILIFDASALHGLSGEVDRIYQVLFFSFTTLTTLGYGDIVPVNKFAIMLANAEAMIGIMYPAVFISRLVSIYRSQEIETRDKS